RRVAQRLEQLGDRRILRRESLLLTRHADLEQAGPEGALSGDERRSSGGARLLTVGVGEEHALPGDAIDVRRPIAHHAEVVGTQVPVTDIVAHDGQDVRQPTGRRPWGGGLLSGGGGTPPASQARGHDTGAEATGGRLDHRPSGCARLQQALPGAPAWRRWTACRAVALGIAGQWESPLCHSRCGVSAAWDRCWCTARSFAPVLSGPISSLGSRWHVSKEGELRSLAANRYPMRD